MVEETNKTRVTGASPDAFLAALTPHERHADALALCRMMNRVTGEPPRMWGRSIVGFGVRHYRYESGREGETPLIGFSPRKEALAIYGLAEAIGDGRAAKLGKVGAGKGCLYVKRLADIDLRGLEALLAASL